MVADEAIAYTFNFKTETETHRFFHAVQPGFLTVIIPVYEDAAGLRDTLDSLSRQTLSSSQFEVIVANDGGDEGIHKTCVEFMVQEVVVRPNKGSYAARNAALAESRGEYLGFTDADVILDSEWCARGLEAMKKSHVVAGAIELIPSGRRTACELFQLAHYFPSENLIKRRMAMTANTFIRREVFECRPWFDDRLRSVGDIEFTQRAGLDPALRFAYDPSIKASHPVRTQAQLNASIKRIVFGQVNAYHLLPSRRNTLAPQIGKTYRQLFPPLRLYSTDLSHLHLKLKDHVALFFYCWWNIKLRTFFLVLEARKQWRQSYKNQTSISRTGAGL